MVHRTEKVVKSASSLSLTMGADQSGDGILVVADGWLCVCVYDVY